MRKIETQMNAAIREARDWKSGNTEVCAHSDGLCYVYLHGNKIAEIYEDCVVLFDGGWQSKTTKSRLNAICTAYAVEGEGVFQKAGEWFCRQWDNAARTWQTVPFESGMVLQ